MSKKALLMKLKGHKTKNLLLFLRTGFLLKLNSVVAYEEVRKSRILPAVLPRPAL